MKCKAKGRLPITQTNHRKFEDLCWIGEDANQLPKPEDMLLKDFVWYSAYRPKDAEDIFVWNAFKMDNSKNKKRKK